MKKLFLCCFGACLSLVVSAQRVYFLYLQTDDQTPFYVRMADKIHSSSTAGYLILPNLTDSNYNIAVGFPKSTQPETRFPVTINQNDKGYLLKNFSDGLALFDVQNLSVVKSSSASNDKTVYETRTDKFSAILSKAADDPSLLKVPVAKKEEPKPKIEEKEVVVSKSPEPTVLEKIKVDSASAQAVTHTQTVTVSSEAPVKTTEQSEQTAEKAQPETTPVPEKSNSPELVTYKPSTISRRSESSTTEGFGIMYLDKELDRVDTIRILIPPSKFSLEQDTQATQMEEPAKKPVLSVVSSEPVAQETVSAQPSSTVVATQKEMPLTKDETPLIVKSGISKGCKELASDKDFMKLRKNMAAKVNDDEMIAEAKKMFKSRCFTTEQIRYLSTLFLTAGAKYQFLDASFGYVADKENFASLQSEIKDDYYLKRFKALVGE